MKCCICFEQGNAEVTHYLLLRPIYAYPSTGGFWSLKCDKCFAQFNRTQTSYIIVQDCDRETYEIEMLKEKL